MSAKNQIKGGRKERLVGSIAGLFMRIYSLLLRYRFDDQTGGIVSGSVLGEGVVFLVWHNRIFGLPRMWSLLGKARRDKELVVLTSASRDGALIESAVSVNGIRAIRGSSSRRGRTAMSEMLGELANGNSLCITPDGPRGPLYSLNAGSIRLAQKAQRPLVLVQVDHSSYWELRTWDRFRIPKPFSQVSVTFQHLEWISKEAENEERDRERVESLLRSPALSP